MQGIPETRNSLIVQLRQPGNQEAWQEFASLYEPLIYRLAARKGLQHADAQDLLQDVLIAVSKSVDRFEISEDRGRFRGWLFKISRNLIINAIEKRQRIVIGNGDSEICRQLAQQPDLNREEQSVYVLEFRRELFHWAARKIRPEYQVSTWSLFWRTSVNDEAIPEVAKELGLSIGAAYAARCRILARLKRTIEELDDLNDFPEQHHLPVARANSDSPLGYADR
jgi:RNA polymerase sigma-70 factor (ECF subfamily)